MVKTFPLRSDLWHGSSMSPLFFNIVLEILVNPIKHVKEIKKIQIEKKEKKLSMFTDGMIIQVENLKEPATRTGNNKH